MHGNMKKTEKRKYQRKKINKRYSFYTALKTEKIFKTFNSLTDKELIDRKQENMGNAAKKVKIRG